MCSCGKAATGRPLASSAGRELFVAEVFACAEGARREVRALVQANEWIHKLLREVLCKRKLVTLVR